MKEFVHTEEFRALNVGFSLDEGVASESDVYNVYYAERAIWRKFKLCKFVTISLTSNFISRCAVQG